MRIYLPPWRLFPVSKGRAKSVYLYFSVPIPGLQFPVSQRDKKKRSGLSRPIMSHNVSWNSHLPMRGRKRWGRGRV